MRLLAAAGTAFFGTLYFLRKEKARAKKSTLFCKAAATLMSLFMLAVCAGQKMCIRDRRYPPCTRAYTPLVQRGYFRL